MGATRGVVLVRGCSSTATRRVNPTGRRTVAEIVIGRARTAAHARILGSAGGGATNHQFSAVSERTLSWTQTSEPSSSVASAGRDTRNRASTSPAATTAQFATSPSASHCKMWPASCVADGWMAALPSPYAAAVAMQRCQASTRKRASMRNERTPLPFLPDACVKRGASKTKFVATSTCTWVTVVLGAWDVGAITTKNK